MGEDKVLALVVKLCLKRFKQIRLISFIQTANKQKIFRIAHNMLNICKISFIICVVTLTKKEFYAET